MLVEQIVNEEEKKKIVREILEALPDWFLVFKGNRQEYGGIGSYGCFKGISS